MITKTSQPAIQIDGDYYAVQRLSNTAMSYLSKSAAHYRAFMEGQIIETPAMRIGRLAHTVLLEPDKALPFALKKDSRTKEGKAYNEMCEAQGITLLSEADYMLIMHGIRNVINHPKVRALLDNSAFETNAYFEYRGIPCKARRDIIGNYQGKKILADTKFVADANDNIIRKAENLYHYDRQMSWYHLSETLTTGEEPDEVWIILIEKTPPYAVRVVTLNSSVLKQGEAKYNTIIDYYEQTVAKGLFPGYTDIDWETYYAEQLYSPDETVDMSQILSSLFGTPSAIQHPVDETQAQANLLAERAKLLIENASDSMATYAMMTNAKPKDEKLVPVYTQAKMLLQAWWAERGCRV